MIQSFSDIITNSSSEVFVIESNDHEKIKTFLADICEVFGWDVNDLMHFESVEEDGRVGDWVLNSQMAIFLFGAMVTILFLVLLWI